MNHSLVTADRTTHLKIVVVALIAAIVVVAGGITAHVASVETASVRTGIEGGVVKAGKPATYTRTGNSTVR